MRAILLASATAATLTGLRSMIRASHSRLVPRWRAYRMTAMAPVISSHRKYRLPCFEIPPSLSLPPVECCLGTSPIQAAKLRPDENAFQSPTCGEHAKAEAWDYRDRPKALALISQILAAAVSEAKACDSFNPRRYRCSLSSDGASSFWRRRLGLAVFSRASWSCCRSSLFVIP
jgi:hypothetical protein